VPNLLMLATGVGLAAAIAALWVQGWRRADHRFFAALVSIAVTLSLFSVVAWAATAIAPLPLTWVLVGTLALLFALRLYRELQEPPPGERSPEPRVMELTSTHHAAGGSAIGSQPAEDEYDD
jgi:hypothetical protein